MNAVRNVFGKTFHLNKPFTRLRRTHILPPRHDQENRFYVKSHDVFIFISHTSE